MLSFIIKYWIELLFSFVITLITHLYRKITKYLKRVDYLEIAACQNIKSNILFKYETIKRRGKISMKEKEDLLVLYETYRNLECSSMMDGMLKELDNIPLE